MQQFPKKEFLILFSYILLCAFAWWRIFFAVNTMPYDMAEQFLPWRFFIGESLQANSLPVWNPYAQMGYPVGYDPQSAAWYPPVWVIGYLTGYSFTSISFEFVLHLLLAALGSYSLARYFKLSTWASWAAGAAWMCCGVFVANGQHMSWVVSASWLPWAVLGIIASYEAWKWRYSLLAGFSLAMILLGGYPAIIIILLYFTITYLIFKSRQILSQKLFVNFLKQSIIIGSTVLLISSVVLAGVYLSGEMISRGGPVSLDAAQSNPFTLISLSSFIFPSLAIDNPNLSNTDRSMMNAYLGFSFVIFLITYLIIKKNNKTIFFLFISGIACWLAALGPQFFLRELLYHYAPLMNMFRHPAIFRVPMMLFLLIPSVYTLDLLLKGQINNRKLWIAVFVFCILIFMAMLPTLQGHFNNNKYVIWQFTSLILILVIFIGVLKYRNKLYPLKFNLIILLLISIDLSIATNINIPWTVTLPFKVKDNDEKLYTLPSKLIIKNDTLVDKYYNPVGLNAWANSNIYYKKVSYTGYNPFMSNLQEKLEVDSLYSSIKKRKLCYYNDSIVLHRPNHKNIPDNIVLLDSSEYEILKNEKIKPGNNDSLELAFNNNTFIISTANYDYPTLITLQQNWWPEWKAYTDDGLNVKLVRSNINSLSILVPKYTQKVYLVFDSPALLKASIVSRISFSLILIILIYGFIVSYIKNKKSSVNKLQMSNTNIIE